MKTVETFDYEIRRGTKADLDQLVDLGARFYSESNFLGNLTISKENYRKTIAPYIEHQNVAAILAVRDGVIIGYVHIYAQNDYTVEMVGELFQFYVTPEYRSTGVARSLVEAAVLQYAEWNCKRAYAEASPGMNDPYHLKLFENLWGRYGYKATGVTMMKEF